MKKFLLFLLVLLLPLCALAEAPAAEVVEAPGLNITLTVPEGYFMLTRDTSASVFNRHGFWQPEMLAMMAEGDIYALFYPLSGEGNYIALMAYEEDYYVIEELTPSDTDYVISDMRNFYASNGYEVEAVTRYNGPNASYIRMDMIYDDVEAGDTYYDRYYYTNRNGNAVDISFSSYAGPTTAEQLDMLEDFVNGITYEELDLAAQVANPTEISFSTEDMTVHLTSPAGMKCVTRQSSEQEFFDLQLYQWEMLDWMKEADVYAMLFEAADLSGWDITIQAMPNEPNDYARMSPMERFTVKTTFKLAFTLDGENEDGRVESIDFVEMGRYTWLRAVFSKVNEGETTYSCMYSAFDGSNMIQVQLDSYIGEITEKQQAILDEVVTSIFCTAID